MAVWPVNKSMRSCEAESLLRDLVFEPCLMWGTLYVLGGIREKQFPDSCCYVVPFSSFSLSYFSLIISFIVLPNGLRLGSVAIVCLTQYEAVVVQTESHSACHHNRLLCGWSHSSPRSVQATNRLYHPWGSWSPTTAIHRKCVYLASQWVTDTSATRGVGRNHGRIRYDP